MASPQPRHPLTGHCSVIHDNTLYAYTPEAFQALPLKTNGTWSQLTGGVSVSGAACVGSQDSLWVVGGSPTDSNSNYPGLQQFSYGSKSWRTVTPQVKVTKNRQSHAAVMLTDTNSILIYGGSQTDDSVPTTESFLVSTKSPYTVQSFSAKNTPVVSPILLPWDGRSAITIGGAEDNTDIYRFQVEQGWQRIRPSLATAPKTSDREKATLVRGSDGSRVLELYDLSVSPNTISQVVLRKANGRPARSGRILGESNSKKRKRDLDLQNWPQYDDTFAPSATRSEFALARSDDGLVAVVGGGDSIQPVALFDEQRNAWVNTTKFFGASAHQKPLIPSQSPSASASPSATGAPLVGGGDHHRTELILGATLGSILGFVALLVILLIYLRWRRRREAERKRKQAEAEEDDEEDDEKDGMSFVDRGDPLAKEVGGGITYPASHHSLSIHEGKAGNIAHRRSETRGSEKSTSRLVNRDEETFEMSAMGEKNLDIPSAGNEASKSSTSLQVPGALEPPKKRTSGWSRYFSGADLSINSRNSKRTSGGDQSNRAMTPTPQTELPGIASKHSSGTTSSHDCSSHGPTELPPLDMGQQFQGKRNSATAAGAQEVDRRSSPVSSMRDSDERPRTVSSGFSRPSTEPSLWSETGREEQTNWTPMTGSDWASRRTRDTTTSSFYGSSMDGHDPKHTSHYSSVAANTPTFSVTAPPSTARPTTVAEEDEESHVAKATAVRVINAPVKLPQEAEVQNDLSWINLGANRPSS